MITNFVTVHRADWPPALGTGGQGAGLGLKLCVMICEQGLDIHLLVATVADCFTVSVNLLKLITQDI